jgi:hypothetical protein
MTHTMDALKAEHNYRRERLERLARPRRDGRGRPSRRRLAATLLSIRVWMSGTGGRTSEGGATDPATAA